jgi:hypothetical protein
MVVLLARTIQADQGFDLGNAAADGKGGDERALGGAGDVLFLADGDEKT